MRSSRFSHSGRWRVAKCLELTHEDSVHLLHLLIARFAILARRCRHLRGKRANDSLSRKPLKNAARTSTARPTAILIGRAYGTGTYQRP